MSRIPSIEYQSSKTQWILDSSDQQVSTLDQNSSELIKNFEG